MSSPRQDTSYTFSRADWWDVVPFFYDVVAASVLGRASEAGAPILDDRASRV